MDASIGSRACCSSACSPRPRHRRRPNSGYHRQGDRRKRLPHSKLRRDGSGLLQGGRARCPLRVFDGKGAGDCRALGQRRLRADPLRRRPGRVERSGNTIHRRRVAEVAVGHRRAQGDRQAGGPEGQDGRLRPRRRCRLRRRRDRARSLLPYERRQGLQGHLVPGRGGADGGADQRRHPGGVGFDAARPQGIGCRDEGAVAYGRLRSTRRAERSGRARPMSTSTPIPSRKSFAPSPRA